MRLFERIAAWFEDRTVPADPRTIANVAGNPYGFARSHDGEYDWQRYDRWDIGGHDHFHHHGSWSASSHDPWRD